MAVALLVSAGRLKKKEEAVMMFVMWLALFRLGSAVGGGVAWKP
ncbi:hypothetical protein [Sorangium sp. So ce1182]